MPMAMIWETPRGRGTIEDGRKVGAKSPVVEVSVGIDEWSGGGVRGGEIHAIGVRGVEGVDLSGFRAGEGLAAIPSRQLPFHSWAA